MYMNRQMGKCQHRKEEECYKMIVVKRCNKCGKLYDTEFMSDAKCRCNIPKVVEIKAKRQKPRENRWNDVPINGLPIASNKRDKEAEAIMAMFSRK